jgi:hypothetical protein
MEVNEPANPAPPKATKADKNWGLRIEAFRFKSDHTLLVDNTADWTKSGAAIPEPEWKRTPFTSGPITHTRKETIEADATFSVPLPTAETKSAVVEGRANINALSFKALGTESYGPGADKTVAVQGTAPLPDLVGRIKRAVAWRAKADKYYAASSSGAHVVFVTYGKPIDTGLVEDGVTLRRMTKTIEWVGRAWAAGKREPVDLIEAVFDRFSHYVLGFEMLTAQQRAYLRGRPAALASMNAAGFAAYMKDSKGGAWPLAELVKYGGECQAIVRLTRAMAHQVGLPGSIEVKYVSSQPADPYKSRVLDVPHSPTGPIAGLNYALVDGPVSVGRQYGKRDGVGFNNYEAYLKYTHGRVTWFGGGIGRMPASMKEDDLVKVFWGLAAISRGGPDPAGGIKFKINRVWQY